MLQHLLVVLGMALADALYTMWARKSAQSKPLSAACWASLIIPTYGYVVIMYNQDPQYLLSAMIGAFVGTYLTVLVDSKGKNEQNPPTPTNFNPFGH